MIEVPGLGDRGPRKLSRQTLADVIEPRVEELYLAGAAGAARVAATRSCCRRASCSPAARAMMPGMVELGEDIFLKPVRVGVPKYRGALADVVRSPRYATVLGLLLEAKKQYLRGASVARAGRVGEGGVGSA